MHEGAVLAPAPTRGSPNAPTSLEADAAVAPRPAGLNAADLHEMAHHDVTAKSKSVMDLIQEDFPRTPSPVLAQRRQHTPPPSLQQQPPPPPPPQALAQRMQAEADASRPPSMAPPAGPSSVTSTLENLSASIQALALPDGHDGERARAPDAAMMHGMPPATAGAARGANGSMRVYPPGEPGYPGGYVAPQYPQAGAYMAQAHPVYSPYGQQPMQPGLHAPGYAYGMARPNDAMAHHTDYSSRNPRLAQVAPPPEYMSMPTPNPYWHSGGASAPRASAHVAPHMSNGVMAPAPPREVFMYYSYSSASQQQQPMSQPAMMYGGGAPSHVPPGGVDHRIEDEKAPPRKERGAPGPKTWKKGGGGSGRSSLLEEFRSTHGKTRAWELEEICGQIVAFCQDQHGSRYIQQRLETAGDGEKQAIFIEVLPRASELMIDVFGNYVIQKLFEHGAWRVFRRDSREQFGTPNIFPRAPLPQAPRHSAKASRSC